MWRASDKSLSNEIIALALESATFPFFLFGSTVATDGSGGSGIRDKNRPQLSLPPPPPPPIVYLSLKSLSVQCFQAVHPIFVLILNHAQKRKEKKRTGR